MAEAQTPTRDRRGVQGVHQPPAQRANKRVVRLRVLSDLHLEFMPRLPDKLPAIGEDVVILAGDIAPGLQGIAWAQRAISDRPVVYVMGNHEYYHQDTAYLLPQARDMCTNTNVNLLENKAVTLRGVRFLGCTLWTDFELPDLEGVSDPGQAMQFARDNMADFRVIRVNERPLQPEDTVGWSMLSRQYWITRSRRMHMARTPMNPWWW